MTLPNPKPTLLPEWASDTTVVLPWAPSTAYTAGTLATNGANVYEVVTGGTSAASGGPTGTGSSILDGTVEWRYLGRAGTAGGITEPLPGRKKRGWVNGEAPPAGFFNWLQWLTWKWTQFLETFAEYRQIWQNAARFEGPDAWAPTTAYVVGEYVANGILGRVYVCTVAGTSAGAGGPSGTGTGIVDGTVTWDYVAPPFEVTTPATLGSRLDVAGALTVGGTADVTGATALGGTLTVAAATQINSTLNATGATTLGASLDVGTTLDVGGATTLGSSLDVTGAATLDSTLTVDGLTNITDNLVVTGSGQFGAGLTVSGTTDTTVLLADVAAVSDGLSLSRTTLNSPALVATGNGTGAAAELTGGATGPGLKTTAGTAATAAIPSTALQVISGYLAFLSTANPNSNVAFANTLTPLSFIKAWGIIDTDGVGGVVLFGGVGHNVASVALNGSEVRVTFATPFTPTPVAGNPTYVVLGGGQVQGEGMTPLPASFTTTTVDLRVWTTSTGSTVNLSTNARTFFFIAIGAQ